MRGARIYYPRVPGLMRDDHRRISSRCVTNRNSSCTTSLDHTRYKTLPAHTPDGPTRYKTLPAARLGGPPGTKLSQQAPKRRFRPTFRMQGELCTASATNNPSRENFIPHAVPLPVQNSPSEPGSAAHPVQNSPSKRPWQAHPVQNSPGTPQNADFGPPFACRENFVPLPPPTTRAGRTLSRMRCHFRYKTLPASGLDRPTRYKTLPASPKTPISAHFSHAGRTLYRFRHQHDEQGEQFRAPTPHRTPTTCPSPNFACNSIE